MIDAGLMSRTAEDTLDDFRAVYDFREAFSDDELIGRLGAVAAGTSSAGAAKAKRRR
jgi:hypothetical protein